MDTDQKLAIASVVDGIAAAGEVQEKHGNPFSDSFTSPLDSWIKPERVDEVLKLLDKAAEKTPDFINGVIVSPYVLEDLYRLLGAIRRDLEFGAKAHHSINGQHKATQTQLGVMISSMLNNLGPNPASKGAD